MTNVTNNLTALFGATNQATTGVTQLGKTAQLTTLAESIAMEVLNKVNSNVEEYQDKIVKSQQSHDAMDDLVNECFDLQSVDIEFLKTERRMCCNACKLCQPVK